jgi:Tfp pilus assembly protein PilO
MKLFFPIFMIIIAGAIFFWYIDPTYADVKNLLAEESQYNDALTKAQELQSVRDQLLARYNTFAQGDLDRLQKLLPDHVDNIRLILDLDSMASKYGMRVHNVSIDNPTGSVAAAPDELGAGSNNYESINFSFVVTGTYDTFRRYLSDLEQSLRLVDVVGITFTPTDTGIYDFTIHLTTYWLKP